MNPWLALALGFGITLPVCFLAGYFLVRPQRDRTPRG